jgi:hypothetical protein
VVTPSAAPQTGGGSSAGWSTGRLLAGLLALLGSLATAGMALRRREAGLRAG